MIKLKCLNCGLTLRREGTAGDFCPRCLAREDRVVRLVVVSDRMSSPALAGSERMAIEARTDGATHTIVLKGELDISSAPLLEATLSEICAAGPLEIVIDMSEVEFVDSTGFNAILRAKALCEARKCGFALTPAQRPVQRMFEATRLRDKLPFLKASGEAAEAAD
jgi:stage II sporulation protein AA (anti-sigma F factor antagonist)